jgi:hypothetical protein
MNALDSLYGKASALSGNVGGQDRKQEVHTRRSFLELAVFPALGGRPGYDPCAATDPQHWFAAHNVTLSSELQQLEACLPFADEAQKKQISKILKDAYATPPPERLDLGSAYANPPFKTLRPWMSWCQNRGREKATIGHWPVRIGNPWWIELCKGGEIVFLSARYGFEGYKAAHPEDCCLVAWGCTIPDLGSLEVWRVKP